MTIKKPLNLTRWEGAPVPADGTMVPLLPQLETSPSDFADLSARLRFCPKDGRIWLDDQRMVLLHLSALASLRHELVNSLGTAAARGLLTRMGYASGCKDAQLAKRIRVSDPVAAFLAGPQLHALEGIVSVETVRAEVDLESGHHYGEFIWHSSSEVDAHFAAFGMSAEPVCWMQIGYASGYTSVFMGQPILYREVECRGTGSHHCRIIGKPVQEWDDPNPDMIYLQPDGLASLVMRDGASSQALPVADDKAMPSGLVGASSGFSAVCQLLKKVAPTNATVLFLGETGVGKEMFARTLHSLSKRCDKPFIAINCAAIPENLVEAELFGVERGAFTGAVQSRPGRFERAHGGTIFLDEIGTLNLAAQGKLLRVLQEREIEPVGGTSSRCVDVRVVAATNVNLRQAVQRGEFREDLFYRLNVFPVHIPPLRERREDIPVLVRHFLGKYSLRHGQTVTGVTDRALDYLLDYDYPGNVRELENIIERAVILCPDDGAPLDVAHLFSPGGEVNTPFFGIGQDGFLTNSREPSSAPPPTTSGSAGGVIEQFLSSELPLDALENLIIQAAVERSGGNLAEAARMLGLTRAQLAYRHRKGANEA
ncbi:MAG TPA: sigma 54-interacting transcriptional regulator [Patescibacteria group bacterium]|nr:sigma 54-interacting transcriptional regulator [Patescibacteria group bacterium]